MRESGQPVTHVARDLGIANHLLYRWRAEQAELVRLRRENAVLKQERDFLTRAVAFFAKESR